MNMKFIGQKKAALSPDIPDPMTAIFCFNIVFILKLKEKTFSE